VILPRETLPPPGDPNGGVVYLRIVLSPEEASLHGYFLTYVFYAEGLLALRPTPNLEDHPSSAVRGCLFNLFTATLHIGGRSSIRNLRTRHTVVTETHIHGCNYPTVLKEKNVEKQKEYNVHYLLAKVRTT
jgi:hypothetical protein